MRAKLINENLNDLFKPKSKEEINKILELNPTHRNYIFISKIKNLMKAKLINEELDDILKPKIGDPNILLKELSDIKTNNERVKYLFEGDISNLLNLSSNSNKFILSKINEIEQKYLELYQISKLLRKNKLTENLNYFFNKYSDDPMGSRYGKIWIGNHFDHIKDSLGYNNYNDTIKLLNSNYFDIIKKYLDKLGIKMINPKLDNNIIIPELTKTINTDTQEKLYKLLKNNSPYLFIPNEENRNSLYPMKNNNI